MGCFFLILFRYLLAFSLRTWIPPKNESFDFWRFSFRHMINDQGTINYHNKKNKRTLDIVSIEGVPRRSVIKSSWWTTFLPGNSGFPDNTSAKMQPMLQISIAGVYCAKGKSITWYRSHNKTRLIDSQEQQNWFNITIRTISYFNARKKYLLLITVWLFMDKRGELGRGLFYIIFWYIILMSKWQIFTSFKSRFTKKSNRLSSWRKMIILN